MKKFMMISMIALAAAGMIGCGAEDDTKADMKWTSNYSGVTVSQIEWVSGSQVDQSWSESLSSVGSDTVHKGITKLVGEGRCLDDGTPGVIEIVPTSEGVYYSSGTSTTINENAVANLVITGSTATK